MSNPLFAPIDLDAIPDEDLEHAAYVLDRMAAYCRRAALAKTAGSTIRQIARHEAEYILAVQIPPEYRWREPDRHIGLAEPDDDGENLDRSAT